MLEKELSSQVADTLTWIADQYTVNWHHVTEVYNMHPEAKKTLTAEGVRSLLRRLTDEGYIEWKQLMRRTPAFVYITQKTIDELGLPYPDYEPTVTQTLPDGTKVGTTNKHMNQINQTRLYLEKTYGRKIGWISERRIRLDQEANRDGTFPHRADGLSFLNSKDTAIEVERSKKGIKRLETIMLDLMARFEQTYYFCTQAETYGLAHRVARDIDPDSRHFQILDWSEII